MEAATQMNKRRLTVLLSVLATGAALYLPAVQAGASGVTAAQATCPPGTTDPNYCPDPSTIGGSSNQDPLKQKNVITVNVGCALDCNLDVGGTLSIPNAAKSYKFKSVKKSLKAGQTAKIKLKIPKKAQGPLKKLLKKGKKAKAKVKVVSTTSIGKKTLVRTIVLKSK